MVGIGSASAQRADHDLLVDEVQACYYRELRLVPGWNLIAVDEGLLTNTVEDVLGPYIAGAAWAWNADSFRYQQATVLEPGRGYWVFHVPGQRGDASRAGETLVPMLYVRTNAPPVAEDDQTITAAGTPVTVPVLDNDFEPDGESLRVVWVSLPGAGTAAVDDNANTIVYTPGVDFADEDVFCYAISDPTAMRTSRVS